ncbi:DUF4747 family protein [Rhodanobacter umsongensis]
MTHERKVPISALNIAMHEPHSPQAYVDLMLGLYAMRRIVNVRTLTGVLIGSMYPFDRRHPDRGLTGEIYQFTNLDRSEPWFDVNALDEASEDDVKDIKIPDHLKPHLARFNYVFFPHGHRFYVQTRNKNRTLGVQSVLKFFRLLLSDESAPQSPPIEVTVEPDRDTIAQILKIKYLKRLEITLVRPNPDDLSVAEKRLLKKLSHQGARQMDVRLHADSSQNLEPDVETVTLAKVAASNGAVVGSGRDAANNPVLMSTVDQPWKEVAHFDEDVQTEKAAIIAKAQEMHQKVRG